MKYKAILIGLILVAAATAATGQVEYETTSSGDFEAQSQDGSSGDSFMVPVHLENSKDGWTVKVHLSQNLIDRLSDTEEKEDRNDSDQNEQDDKQEDSDEADNRDDEDKDEDQDEKDDNEQDSGEEDKESGENDGNEEPQENDSERDEQNEDNETEQDEGNQDEEYNRDVEYKGEYRYCYEYNGDYKDLYDKWKNGELPTLEFKFLTPTGEGTASLDYNESSCGEQDGDNSDGTDGSDDDSADDGNEDDVGDDDQNDSSNDTDDGSENSTEWDADVSTINAACISGNQTGIEDVSHSEDEERVTWTGYIQTPDPCYEANLGDVVQTGENSYQLDVTTEAEDGNCQQCVGIVEYEAEFSTDESFDLEVLHDGEQAGTITYPAEDDNSDDDDNSDQDGDEDNSNDTGEDDNSTGDDSPNQNETENETGVTEEAAQIEAPEEGDYWFEAQGDGWISYINPRDEYRSDYISGTDGPGSGKVCTVLLNEEGEPITGETLPNTEVTFPMGDNLDWHPHASPINAEYPLTENYERPFDSDQFGTSPDMPQGDGYMDSHCIEFHQMPEDALIEYGQAEVTGEHADDVEIVGYYDKLNTWDSDVDPLEIADPYGATSSSDGEIQFSPGNTHGEAYVIMQLDR